jgi:hypothetical protein
MGRRYSREARDAKYAPVGIPARNGKKHQQSRERDVDYDLIDRIRDEDELEWYDVSGRAGPVDER